MDWIAAFREAFDPEGEYEEFGSWFVTPVGTYGIG